MTGFMMIPFKKMHGLGNDFVVIDARAGNAPDQAAIVRMADRHLGIGCDQVLVLGEAEDKNADLFMRIYNPDGSEAQACGNGTRCVARLFMDESGRRECTVQTVAGLIFAVVAHVDWWVVLLIGVGSVIGGQVGATVGRRLPGAVLRVVIVVVGLVALSVFLLT